MKRKKSRTSIVVGSVLFFLTDAFIVTVAVLVYALVTERTENQNIVAAVMFAVILALTLLCTLIDVIRRHFMGDRRAKRILDATDRIASGDFSVRLEIKHSYRHYDEFDYIMENLNRMTGELAKTEILHADFISNVSHELKTPLAVIQSYASSLQDATLDAETRKKYAQTLVSASKRLTDLIMSILKLNKLEHQELKPEFVKIRLDEMLAEAILRYEEQIDDKKLRLECDLEEVVILSSPEYLEIVWNNLLSNAIKFTDEGGTIGVSLRRRGEKVTVRVSDTGCGISQEVGAHIFEKFYQGDTSHAKEGNGLGLALVKKVIDIIGGEISVESEIGKGSIFTVVLSGGVL